MSVAGSSINELNGWYWQNPILKIIMQNTGALVDDFRLEKGLKQLSDSANLWNAVLGTSSEYFSLSGRQICEDKGKKSTGRSVSKHEFMDHYINYEDPIVEISQSVWQEDINGLPKRTIMYIDIEFYDNRGNDSILINQREVFRNLEPFYQYVKEFLLQLGIEHIAVMTGRGYNFLSQVPWDSPVLERLIGLGYNVEDSVVGKQNTYEYKRRKSVPINAERSFNGMMRLVLYLMNNIIRRLQRNRVSGLDIGFSDKSAVGVSFDPTFLTRSIDRSVFGVPYGPYLKLHFMKYDVSGHVASNTMIPIRIIRSKNGGEYFNSVEDALWARTDYRRIINLADKQEGYIPDGSEGINNLINLYSDSGLKQFYDWFDSEEHEHWMNWNKTYRNLHAILSDIPEIGWIIERPNPYLLQPDKLEFLINIMYDRGWSPKHIAGFIRSFYEHPEGYWEGRFDKYDAAKWANGWVQINLASRFN